MRKGIVAAMAMMGLAGTSAISSVNDFNRAVDSIGTEKALDKSDQNRNKQPVNKQSLTEKQVKTFKRTHLAHNTFQDYGISPKIYGMHHVKRGTHKRTNI